VRNRPDEIEIIAISFDFWPAVGDIASAGTMAAPVESIRPSRAPVLTRRRIVLALFIAVTADGLQFVTGPFGWVFADQAIDVIAMLLTIWALGFHWLLLPTFALELVPGLDDLPTWTACVIAVIALRKRAQRMATTAATSQAATPALPPETQRP
jgi:hypothetical protein